MTLLSSGLARRVATAVVGLPLLLAAIFWAPPAVYAVFVTAVLLVGALEYFELARANGLPGERALGVVLVLLALAGSAAGAAGPLERWLAVLSPTLVVTAALLLAPLAAVARSNGVSQVFPSAAATLFGVVYIGVLGGTLIGLHQLPQGDWLVLSLLAVCWGCDTGAYFTGKLIGRYKLAPRISPGKTVEGAVGGLLVGTAAGTAVAQLGGLSLSVVSFVLLALLLCACSQLGDLVESAIKRGGGLKDSGRFFPGHGGVLDRLDSLLFAAPVMYHYWSNFVIS